MCNPAKSCRPVNYPLRRPLTSIAIPALGYHLLMLASLLPRGGQTGCRFPRVQTSKMRRSIGRKSTGARCYYVKVIRKCNRDFQDWLLWYRGFDISMLSYRCLVLLSSDIVHVQRVDFCLIRIRASTWFMDDTQVVIVTSLDPYHVLAEITKPCRRHTAHSCRSPLARRINGWR